MQRVNQKYILNIVRKALNEDLSPSGDVTTNLLKFKDKIVKAKIISRQNGVLSGINFCKMAFKIIGKETIFKTKCKDGQKIKKNKIIAEIIAKNKTLLSAERTALNFLNHSSGISTATNQLVRKVGKNTKICCTRKTTPNLRALEKYAVRKGGGINHRYNLSDEILIKENHLKSISDIKKFIKKAKKTKKIITIEVENIKQLKEIMGLDFKRVLFDNMSISKLKECLKICKSKYETEYSGNANFKNILKISKTGVHRISVGSITHSSKYFDSSLLI